MARCHRQNFTSPFSAWHLWAWLMTHSEPFALSSTLTFEARDRYRSFCCREKLPRRSSVPPNCSHNYRSANYSWTLPRFWAQKYFPQAESRIRVCFSFCPKAEHVSCHVRNRALRSFASHKAKSTRESRNLTCKKKPPRNRSRVASRLVRWLVRTSLTDYNPEKETKMKTLRFRDFTCKLLGSPCSASAS
jgi:hypothetical protein